MASGAGDIVGDADWSTSETRGFRRLLLGSDVLLGGWCMLPSTMTVEIMARSGFDWLGIDMQHGLIGYTDMVAMGQVLNLAGMPFLVRVGQNDPMLIAQAVDAGADGVIVPMVQSAEEALVAARACRYPPAGGRSWGPARAHVAGSSRTPHELNRHAICFVQIETSIAVDRADQIASTAGVDGIYVGPGDLALSIGLQPTLRVTTVAHENLVQRSLDACLRNGVIPALHTAGDDLALGWGGAGFRMLTVGTDLSFLEEAAASRVADLKRGRP